MERKEKIVLYGAGGVAIIALFLALKKGASSSTVIGSGGDSYTSGDVDAGDFSSTVNVGLNPNAYKGLSQNFMPLFGYVGVGVTNVNNPYAQHIEVNVTNTQLQPPTRTPQIVHNFSGVTARPSYSGLINYAQPNSPLVAQTMNIAPSGNSIQHFLMGQGYVNSPIGVTQMVR